MDGNNFASKTVARAISEYISSKNSPEGIVYNSFFVVAIRKLVQIYDELDILMPFQTGNEELLDINLSKYGYAKESIVAFKAALDRYAINANNDDFILIEKMLIDMFIKKRLSMEVTDGEITGFKDLVASPYASNPLIISYNFLMANNPMEVIEYFNKAIDENQKQVIVKAKELLNLGAYEILKYSLDDIKAMNADEIDSINKKVYAYFNINENAINKKYLLDKAVYDYNNPKAAMSTGNGYVDILFFMAVLATITMIIIVLTVIFA